MTRATSSAVFFGALFAAACTPGRDAPTPGPSSTAATAATAASAKPEAASRPAIGRGDEAPAFSLQGSDGKTHALADHRGKDVVVVAWFPKAFTGG
jgi:hypothetical protein